MGVPDTAVSSGDMAWGAPFWDRSASPEAKGVGKQALMVVAAITSSPRLSVQVSPCGTGAIPVCCINTVPSTAGCDKQSVIRKLVVAWI